jgi:ParB/RepB/Spo0J family partition protein
MTEHLGPARLLATGDVSVDRLRPTPDNRPDGSGDDGLEGLAATIRVLGVLQPLQLEPVKGQKGYYWIRDGWRRWTAAQMAGLTRVPAKVYAPLTGLSQAAAAALIGVVTNNQAPLGPVEKAMKFAALRKEMSVAEIAQITGLSSQTISYHLQLAKADEHTLQAVRDGKLTAGSVHDLITSMLPARRQARGRAGRGQQGRPRPARAAAYLNAAHPLATAAHALCLTERHPAADRIGKVACVPCWERAIRADQDELGRQRGDGRRAVSFFNTAHPLAGAARALCDQEKHPAADRIGNLACLPCWERAIRADQDEMRRQRGDGQLAVLAS